MKLTPRQQQIFDALDEEPRNPYEVANRAKIRTVSPYETASTFCRQLVKLGLAERCGTHMHPAWRRKSP